MSIEVFELQDDAGQLSERELTKADAKREYMVKGTFSHSEAFLAGYDEAPETVELGGETLYLDKSQCENIEADLWKFTATYVSEEEKHEQEIENNSSNTTEPTEPQWEVDTKGGTHHITTSFGTKIFGSGLNGQPYSANSNAINIRKTKTGFDIKGLDVVIPALEITATIVYPREQITIDWVKNVARATGKTNLFPWRGFDAGELLFKGASIRTAKFATIAIAYSFTASENIDQGDQFQVGELPDLIVKGGHEYLWVEYENVDAVANDGVLKIFPRARYAYVEKIYRDFDFIELGF
jgi:hypothetical protein